MRNFDFEVIIKNGHSTRFSGANKADFEAIKNYFTNSEVKVVIIKEPHDGEIDSDGDEGRIEDDEMEAREEESFDDDFVAHEDKSSGEEEDADYEVA